MSEMRNCKEVPITDVLTFIVDNRGKTVPTSDSGFPLIATNCVLNTHLYPVFDKIRYVSQETLHTWFRAELMPNDILFVNKGTPGRVCLVPDPVSFCAAQDMIGLRANPKLVDYRYLLAVLRSPAIQRKIQNYHVGIAIPHFKKEDLKNLCIPLPSMATQRKIGEAYFAISEKIENNNAICAELEAMAKLLYDYWFVQFDFPDENGKPYKSSGGKMVWSEELKREIPEGWEVKCCSDILDVVTGKEDANFATEDGQYAFFTCGSDILKCNTYKFDGKMILLAGNGDFNVKCFEGKCNAYQRTYVLMPREEKYIGLLYQSVLRAIAALKKGSAGSIVKFITKSDVENIKLLIPHDDAILDSFNNVFSFTEHIKKENAKLSSLRDFLLPLLMNGQVTFKEADCH